MATGSHPGLCLFIRQQESGPEGCHELVGNLKGTFLINLVQPYRLLFKPLEDDPPKDREEEKERWASITQIEIVGIVDTHG